MTANAVLTLWDTSIGKKAVMAVTGLALVGFVVVHMLGNLKIFQGEATPERDERVRSMVAAMDAERLGSCTNIGECEAVCPKGIGLEFIARMNRDLLAATFKRRVRS
jgi:succinate dehydrogenase iron-sulfur subunit